MNNLYFKWVALIFSVVTLNLFTLAYHERTLSGRYSQGQVFVLDQKTGAMYKPRDGKRDAMWHSIEENPQEDGYEEVKQSQQPEQLKAKGVKEVDALGVPILRKSTNGSEENEELDALGLPKLKRRESDEEPNNEIAQDTIPPWERNWNSEDR
jgi:hypothetical protein